MWEPETSKSRPSGHTAYIKLQPAKGALRYRR